ncbi:hypothetical protein V6Z11_D12G068100 [Gossypium hirsutum]
MINQVCYYNHLMIDLWAYSYKENGCNSGAKIVKEKRVARKGNLEARLAELYECDLEEDTIAELMEVQINLNLEVDKEELFWKQKAQVNWLVNGDKNTTFFHNFTSTRRRKNKILGLEDEQGHWVMNGEDLLMIASSYFVKFFSASMVGDAS